MQSKPQTWQGKQSLRLLPGCFGIAAIGLLALAPFASTRVTPAGSEKASTAPGRGESPTTEAIRLNNLGVAYMNQ
ncbi:MAG: hypothetical protein V3T65_00580, partial [Acidobacteriota bacterium]